MIFRLISNGFFFFFIIIIVEAEGQIFAMSRLEPRPLLFHRCKWRSISEKEHDLINHSYWRREIKSYRNEFHIVYYIPLLSSHGILLNKSSVFPWFDSPLNYLFINYLSIYSYYNRLARRHQSVSFLILKPTNSSWQIKFIKISEFKWLFYYSNTLESEQNDN